MMVPSSNWEPLLVFFLAFQVVRHNLSKAAVATQARSHWQSSVVIPAFLL